MQKILKDGCQFIQFLMLGKDVLEKLKQTQGKISQLNPILNHVLSDPILSSRLMFLKKIPNS
jgi:hypothetical protein